uniref:Uncharacterized protein n=1 Tax=Meloidogyne javanica TaxID=6303 RepID=A0A915MLK3_MELJA
MMENDEMEEDLNSTTNAMSNLSLDRNAQHQIIHDLNRRLVQITHEIKQMNNKLKKDTEEYYRILNQDSEDFENGATEQSHFLVEYERQISHLEQEKKNLENEKDRGSGGSSGSSSTHFHRRGF